MTLSTHGYSPHNNGDYVKITLHEREMSLEGVANAFDSVERDDDGSEGDEYGNKGVENVVVHVDDYNLFGNAGNGGPLPGNHRAHENVNPETLLQVPPADSGSALYADSFPILSSADKALDTSNLYKKAGKSPVSSLRIEDRSYGTISEEIPETRLCEKLDSAEQSDNRKLERGALVIQKEDICSRKIVIGSGMCNSPPTNLEEENSIGLEYDEYAFYNTCDEGNPLLNENTDDRAEENGINMLHSSIRPSISVRSPSPNFLGSTPSSYLGISRSMSNNSGMSKSPLYRHDADIMQNEHVGCGNKDLHDTATSYSFSNNSQLKCNRSRSTNNLSSLRTNISNTGSAGECFSNIRRNLSSHQNLLSRNSHHPAAKSPVRTSSIGSMNAFGLHLSHPSLCSGGSSKMIRSSSNKSVYSLYGPQKSPQNLPRLSSKLLVDGGGVAGGKGEGVDSREIDNGSSTVGGNSTQSSEGPFMSEFPLGTIFTPIPGTYSGSTPANRVASPYFSAPRARFIV